MMIEELIRAAVEQGAHDGTEPRNKTDGKSRNKRRTDEDAWRQIVYRAACYKGVVLTSKLLGNRHLQSKIPASDKKRVIDAYLLARG